MHWEDWCWSWNSNTLATWCEEMTRKRPWCWARLRAGGEGDNRGWDGRMASLTQWTWVRVNFGRWWQTGRPGMLRSTGYKELDMTERLNWTVYQQSYKCVFFFFLWIIGETTEAQKPSNPWPRLLLRWIFSHRSDYGEHSFYYQRWCRELIFF